MPLYEYECVNCGSEQDRRVNLEDRDVTWYCPDCHVGSMGRKFSVPWDAPIPGIPNRVNMLWNEQGPTKTTTRARQMRGDDRPLLGKKPKP